MARKSKPLAPDVAELYLSAMAAAGLPKDQARRFVEYGYVALPSMLPFHAMARECDRQTGPDEVALGGTRGPGKSHAAFSQMALDDCQRVAGLKWLFLRKIQKSAAESFEDLAARILLHCPHERNNDRIEFPNGSRILLGGYHDDRDIEKYLGLEYDGVLIEEATQISEDKLDRLYGSVRSTVAGWRPRKYLTTNPDGIGLQWFKRKFVQPWRDNKQTFTRFLHASYKDNPFLDESYIRYLENLKGPLAAAWREGDWDAFEGQAFPNWNYERHVIQPIQLPAHWVRWRAIDWGYAAPFCCLWLARDPDTRRVYVYREAYQTNLTDVQQARLILDMTPPDEHISLTYADPSMWGRKVSENTVTTTADTYRQAGVMLTKADNDRLSGKRKIDQTLGDLPDAAPGLVVLSTCVHLIEQLSNLPYDKIKVEDVDTDAEDHAYDALRYGLTNLAVPAANPAKKSINPYSFVRSRL